MRQKMPVRMDKCLDLIHHILRLCMNLISQSRNTATEIADIRGRGAPDLTLPDFRTLKLPDFRTLIQDTGLPDFDYTKQILQFLTLRN